MRLNILSLPVVIAALYYCAFTAPATSPADGFVKHTVRKGETVSLICIDFYGHYRGELGKAIQKDNPALKDINLIVPGQVLALRNPDYKGAKPAEATSVFERTLQATQGVVTYVEGDASLLVKSAKGRQKLAANTVVNPGDAITTAANGRVELIVNRETVVRLKENTHMTLEAFRDAGKNSGRTKMGFNLGSVWTKMKKFSDKVSRFELELPTAIAGVHGTVYEASIEKDSSSEVKVFAGEVAVKNNPAVHAAAGGEVGEVIGPGEVEGPREVSMDEWVTIVHDMQRIRVDKEGKPRPVEEFKKNDHDSWEQWNEARDKRIAELFEESE
jgi:phage tail protein X